MHRKFTLLFLVATICYAMMWSVAGATSPILGDESTDSLDSLLSTPVITVAKYWQESRFAPSSVSIIVQRDIQRFGWRTIEDVLKASAGFHIGYDRSYSYVGSRGFLRSGDYNNKILLLLDGNTINEGIYGAAPTGTDFPLNPDFIERIEIVRGPGSVIYGTGAMLAVINIITRKPLALPLVAVTGEFGSFGRKVGRIAGGNEFGNGLGFSYSGVYGDITGQDFYYKEYDDSLTLNGQARGLDDEKFYSANVTLTYQDVALRAVAFGRKKTIPTAPFGTQFGGKTTTADYRISTDALYESKLSFNTQLTARAYLNRYAYYGYWTYKNDISYDTTQNMWLGADVQFRWDISPEHKIVAGTEWKRNFQANLSVTHTVGKGFEVDLPYTVSSGYVQGESWIFPEVLVTAGARFDHYSYYGDAVTPRVAIVYSPSSATSLKLLYGRAYRAPGLSEMFYADPNSHEVANDKLEPEEIGTFEAILEHQISPELNFVLSAYKFSVNDIIEQLELVDSVRNPPDTSVQYVNTMRVQSFGFEGEVGARLSNGTRAYLRLGVLHAAQNNSDDQTTNSPVATIKAGLARQFFTTLTVAAEALWESKRTTEYQTETPDFLLVSCNLDCRLPSGLATLSLNVRNIFDTEYYYPAGTSLIQPAVRQDGRAFILSARVQL